MRNENENFEGNIEISESVIITFVEKVVADINGLMLSKKKKCVKITAVEKAKKIDLLVDIEYGINIPETVVTLQKEVKKSIKTMTGVNITEVNVVVDGISIDKIIDK